MADDAATGFEESQVTFNVKAANDQKHVLTLPSSTTVTDLKAKLSTSEFADIPAERQRLIYSGRVLKDHDTLATVKIKDGHTVHLVKGAASNARQNPANQGTAGGTSGSSSPAPQVPTNIAAGTGNNPLAGLTGARYAGFHGLPGMDTFGPDGGMGPPPTTESLLELMENPMFVTQMTEAMNNPAVVDMMLQNPMIRNNPMLQEMIRNPDMRRMMFSPEMMRMQMQMQRAMDRGGSGGGDSSFPAPGATDNTPQPGSTTAGDRAQPLSETPANPFAAAPGSVNANPFASLFAGGADSFAFTQQQQQQQQQTPANPSSANPTSPTNSSTQQNPFGNLFGAQGGQPNPIAEAARNIMQNPEAMHSMMQMMGGGAGGDPNANPFNPFAQQPLANSTGSAPTNPTTTSPTPQQNPFAALFGPGGAFAGGSPFGNNATPPPPVDNRPPEQVYEVQLRQLNEMGFYEFERNVSALRRSGGNVQGAIEFLLGGGV